MPEAVRISTKGRRDFAMLAPKIEVSQPGAFAKWIKSRAKLGDQNKVPRIILDAKLFQSLLAVRA